MFLIYPFLAIASLATTLLSWLLNPIVVLFVDKDGNLPKYLSYFQTFDAPLPKGYFSGLKWLMRNPAYGFDLFVYGLKWEPKDWAIRKSVSTEEYDFFIATNKYGAFNVYYGHKRKEIYVKLGWKAFNFYNRVEKDLSAPWDSYGKVPLCFSFMWKQ